VLVRARRWRQIGYDLALVLCLALFAWLGLRVYHSVDQLTSLGRGVSQAGSQVSAGFTAAASAARGIPVIGGPLAAALAHGGSAAGGEVRSIGRAGERSAHHLATLLGLVTWGLPTALLLILVFPGRAIRAVRRARARRAIRAARSDEERRLIALRALVVLPDRELFAHTPDPAGDMLAGRYDGLIAAALDDLRFGAGPPP
jgi:RNase P protein component